MNLLVEHLQTPLPAIEFQSFVFPPKGAATTPQGKRTEDRDIQYVTMENPIHLAQSQERYHWGGDGGRT